jgi:nitrogen-specific signal transduction histidine kinase
LKPFTPAQLATFPGAVWVIEKSLGFVQQNQLASDATSEWSGKSGKNSFDFILNSEFESLNQLKSYILSGFEGNSSDFEIKLNPVDSKSKLWHIGIRPIFDEMGLIKLIAIHAIMLPKLSKRMARLEAENKALKELVLAPSYILRSPLSSMLGLLDLIDPNQLDQENKKYFSYLKPLAKELDEVIRVNAKRVSAFD